MRPTQRCSQTKIIIHYITDLFAKEELDFGATKVEMELRHWQLVIMKKQ